MTTLKRKSVLQITTKEPQLTQVIAFKPRTAQLQVLPQQTLSIFRQKTAGPLEPMRKLPKSKTFAAEKTSGTISRLFGENLVAGGRIEVELPLGTPRYVTAVTLKRLLKGSRRDALLKNDGDTWSICEDDLRIDLHDSTNQFRVGPVAVYS